MKKKFLTVLIILVLDILLNIFGMGLYHQNVYYTANYSQKKILSIKPSNWILAKVRYPIAYPGVSIPIIVSNYGIIPTSNHINVSDNSSFIGFPFTFYFKNKNPPKTGSLLSPATISAYSVYWLIVDIIVYIILAMLTFGIFVIMGRIKNHTSQKSTQTSN